MNIHPNDLIELTHPVAMLLLGVAFGLMIIILLLAHTVLGAIDIYKEKHFTRKSLLSGVPQMCFTAETITPPLSDTVLWLLLAAIVAELIAIMGLLRVLRFLTDIPLRRESWILSFMMIALVGYLLIFPITHPGSMQTTTITAAPAAATVKIDEQNVPLLSEATNVAEGRKIFVSKCAMCHGNQGQGMIGPNLTDDYWLHGGKVNDIFHTIKYGVPEKGMQAWGKNLSDQQMAQLTGYIRSVRNSDPPEAKAKEGELYAE